MIAEFWAAWLSFLEALADPFDVFEDEDPEDIVIVPHGTVNLRCSRGLKGYPRVDK